MGASVVLMQAVTTETTLIIWSAYLLGTTWLVCGASDDSTGNKCNSGTMKGRDGGRTTHGEVGVQFRE